jgi:hypothetical protein
MEVPSGVISVPQLLVHPVGGAAGLLASGGLQLADLAKLCEESHKTGGACQWKNCRRSLPPWIEFYETQPKAGRNNNPGRHGSGGSLHKVLQMKRI